MKINGEEVTSLNNHWHQYDANTQRCLWCGLTRLELEGLPVGTWFQRRLKAVRTGEKENEHGE